MVMLVLLGKCIDFSQSDGQGHSHGGGVWQNVLTFHKPTERHFTTQWA